MVDICNSVASATCDCHHECYATWGHVSLLLL